MGLIKQISVTIDTSAESKIAQMKARIAQVNTQVTESKVKLEYLKKQYDELKAQAAGMGVQDTKELPNIIAQTEADLTEMLSQVELALQQAEQVING